MPSPVAPEAAVSGAPRSGCTNSSGAIIQANVEEAGLLLRRLLGYRLVEDPLARSCVFGIVKGRGVSVQPPVPDPICRHLVAEADDESLDEIGVSLLVGGGHVGVGAAVQETQAGRPGNDRFALLLGGLVEVDPGDVGGGGGEEALFVEVEEEGDVLGVGDDGPGSQACGQAIANWNIGNILLGGPGHSHRDLAALAAVVPSIDGSCYCKILPPPQPLRLVA